MGGWVDVGQRLESRKAEYCPNAYSVLQCRLSKKYSAQGLCGLLSEHCGTEVNCIVMENTLMNQNSQGFVFY